MVEARPQNIFLKALWLVRRRPGAIWSTARGFLLFHKAALLRRFPGFHLKGIELGDNVRLQNNRSLMAELPNARIRVADDCVIYENAGVGAYGDGHVEIGEGSILGDIRIVSRYRVKIGRRFLSSWNVFIQDFDPHPVDPELRGLQVADMANQMRPWMSKSGRKPRPRQLDPAVWNFPGDAVVIGDDVWVGANCTILKGARIGNGCVVAAGSVVPKGDYPDRSIIGGSPARVIKTIGG